MSKREWDFETDFLVVGTGAAGLSATITARRNGLHALLIESMNTWGGTTAVSGGALWMPSNPLMIRDGEDDDFDAALDYMRDTVGNPGRWANDERKRAFLHGVGHYVTMLENEGVKWARSKDYPDYYPDLPGGRIGRSIETKPFNVYRLPKELRRTMTPPAAPAPLMNSDFWLLSRAWSSLSGFVHGARFVLRCLGSLVTFQKKIGMGGGLVASLMYIVKKYDTPVWRNSPLKELIVEDGRIVGAVVERNGKTVTIRTYRGVMLGAGGFAHNKDWRMKYHGVSGWSAAPDGQFGEGIEIGDKVGGALAMMDDAWWGATSAQPDGELQHGFILNERSDPWSIVVDQTGQRYTNESESYIDFGHHMFERDKATKGKAVPSWLIMDRRHRASFLNVALMKPGASKKLAAQGELVKAQSLEELARKMSVNQKTFLETVERFNRFARNGVDEDFGRGRTEYDRYYSSPLVKPNPNLGTIEKGPFTALKIYPGDLGTKGGLITDEWARVLRKDGSIIAGLYAAGNNTASVMGHTYPGPGSTIAPAAIFGYLGALHASQQAQNPGHENESHPPVGE